MFLAEPPDLGAGSPTTPTRAFNESLKTKVKKEIGSAKGVASVGKEQQIRKKIARQCWAVARQLAKIHMSTAKLQIYDEAFKILKMKSGKTQIDDIITAFQTAVDQNGILNIKLGELDQELDEFDGEVQRLKKEYSKFRMEKIQY